MNFAGTTFKIFFYIKNNHFISKSNIILYQLAKFRVKTKNRKIKKKSA